MLQAHEPLQNKSFTHLEATVELPRSLYIDRALLPRPFRSTVDFSWVQALQRQQALVAKLLRELDPRELDVLQSRVAASAAGREAGGGAAGVEVGLGDDAQV